MLKKIYSLLFVFLFTVISYAQVTYQGPVSGTTSAGVILNTNNFLTYSNDRPFRFRMFANQNVADIESPSTEYYSSAPEGSNLFLNPQLNGKALTPDNVIVFTSVKGILQGNSIPPDPYLAVGPNHIIQTVNIDFRITDKSGNNAVTINGNTWYKNVYSQASVFDPKVVYDHFSNRWIMVWLHQSDTALEGVYLLSISDDDDPNGIWYNWVLRSDLNGMSPSSSWGDYQGVGFDDKAIYFTSNQFSFTGTFIGAKIRIIPKAQLLTNTDPGPITYTDLYNVTYPNGGANAFGIRPVRMQTASESYYFAVHSPYTSKNTFGIYTLKNPLTNPVLTGSSVPVTSYSTPPDPEQLGGGSPKIDGGGANLRNEPVFKDYVIHLVHSTRVGVYSGVRYLAISTQTNSALTDMVIGDASHFHTYPAIAVSQDDDVLITYSKSSANMYMGAYYTIIPSQTGTPSESIELQSGKGNYVKTFSGTRNRWGDYNGAWIDPADPDNFFMFTEYVDATNTWGCWLGGVRIKPYPDVTAAFTKSELDFSYQELEVPSDTLTVKLFSYGTPLLNITNIQSSNSAFKITNNLSFPINLNSFESIELKVVFTSSEEKNYLDSIVVSSNDFDEPSKSILLKGIGYKIVPATANVLYSTSGSSTLCKLITINPSNGQSTVVGESSIGKLYSLTVDRNKRELYTLVETTPNSKIARIDATNGKAVVYRDLGLDLKAIAFDNNNELYAISKDKNLYKINTKDWSYTLKTPVDLSVSAIAFEPITNLLWASSDSSTNKDRVYKIDLNTGKSTLVGGTTFNYTIAGLSFDKDKNLMGLILKTFLRGMLIKIDKSTGVATELGSTNFASTLGFTILSDSVVSVNDNNKLNPAEFSLSQNYPNPFNPTTTINFTLPVNATVRLVIYNLLGEEVQTLVNQFMFSGSHSVRFNAKSSSHGDLTSGIYLYKINAVGVNGKEFNQTKKMILVK